jgi:TonB-dependent receptor
MKFTSFLWGSASVAGLLATAAQAQTADPAADATPKTDQAGAAPSSNNPEIVVRGIRSSLAKAALLKKNADQVVDSIVAEDIGKFPDPTVASALQRVPGVQVSVSGNNEIANPIIRGLGDILTTLNGREIFTGTSRGFSFQDLPAEALAGADVYKSNSANLIEGGVAGAIDLKLHKAFDFKKPTISGTLVGNYTPESKAVNPTLGLLVADRWNTGIGEIGILFDLSYSYNKYSRRTPFNDNLRALLQPTNGADGVVIPAAATYLNENGEYQRPQANFSFQWKPSSDLEVYTEGLFAGFRSRYANSYSLYDVTSAQSVTNIKTNDDCADYLIDTGSGFAGFANPDGSLPANVRQEHLCTTAAYTANNGNLLGLTEAHHATTNLFLGAGGFKYNHDRLHANFDVSYQRSRTIDNSFSLIIGKQITGFTGVTDKGGGVAVSATDPSEVTDPSGYRLNGMSENRTRGTGQLFTAKGDATYDVGGFIENIQAGFRFASRKAQYDQAYQGANPPPGDPLVSDIGLPSNFLTLVDYPNRINDGGQFRTGSIDYMLSPEVQNIIRGAYGLALGAPAYQPERGFDAREKTYAGYLQTKYKVELGGPVVLDGLVGFRLTKTDRDIAGNGVVVGADGTTTITPVAGRTSDTDFLPNASARLQLGGGLQARVTYAKTLSRPDFGSLNPGLNYTVSTNQYVLNSGSGGNPDLKPEKADGYDATLEYYFHRNDYVSIGGYYKKITNRITSAIAQEAIGGIEYNISRPRNIGSATLKGVEISGQMFFDFLPGAFSGLGTFANFTIADSKVTTKSDPLFGKELTGVSKYSYNVGLIYEKYGISTRVVYTYRSRQIGYDLTLAQDVRPVNDLVYVNENRPLGRLDFSVNYDIIKNITLTLDGTNVLGAKTKSYRANGDGSVLLPRDISYDDSSFSLGVRFIF